MKHFHLVVNLQVHFVPQLMHQNPTVVVFYMAFEEHMMKVSIYLPRQFLEHSTCILLHFVSAH